jgi:hypothetical protein
MSLSATLATTLSYATVLCLSIIFTAFAIGVKDSFWSTALKIIAGLFWFVMAVGQFIFFGADGAFMILSLPYAIFGLLFYVAIMRDSLSERKHRQWDFEE